MSKSFLHLQRVEARGEASKEEEEEDNEDKRKRTKRGWRRRRRRRNQRDEGRHSTKRSPNRFIAEEEGRGKR